MHRAQGIMAVMHDFTKEYKNAGTTNGVKDDPVPEIVPVMAAGDS